MKFIEMITPVDCIVTEESTLKDAIEWMYRKKWNLLPVMDFEQRLIGVFTRSSLFQMVLNEVPLSSSIGPFIKRNAETIQLDTPYERIETVVKESRVGTGVVLDEWGKVTGILTKTDMVMSLLQSTRTLKYQLETILQHSNLGVLMTNAKREIIYVNAKLCQMSGFTEVDMLHQNAKALFPQLSTAFSTEHSILPISFQQYKTVLSISSYQIDGQDNGYIVLFQDVSEIERMAEELQTVKHLKKSLETVLENAYDGILMTDEKKKVRMVSPPLLELFNLTLNDVLHQPVEKVLPQLHLEKVYHTETAEVSDFLEINGIKYIVRRIPILQEGKVIGAIGKVMFRQLNEVSELFKKLQRAENKASFYHQQYRQAESARFTWEHIWSIDSYMEKLKKSAAKAAKGRSTVLIRGESGTGKELFAHAIHNSSARSDGKFVIVNCAAIPEDLLESEFFGYEEGAFTGARKNGKIGKFDLANGGTLFLDEIGDMSVTLQAKLLRVLQEREFYRVGGNTKIHVDVRIITATNRNLEEMVKEGHFREDLYYRLNVISLNVPPLRERPGDISHLISIITAELNSILGTSITGMEDAARKALLHYGWPGNVRELKNVLERAMTFAEHGKIQLEDLPDYMIKNIPMAEDSMQVSVVEHAELEAIKKALLQMKGNKVKAARLLGISRSGLYEKIKKYQLPY
ncbi:MAG: sigma 54-interacting transcriptional regulator [Bacillota bacterium]|nr:sigma 54-interacting transcriptional regulator [Bacillota bacterium]